MITTVAFDQLQPLTIIAISSNVLTIDVEAGDVEVNGVTLQTEFIDIASTTYKK